MYFTCTLDDGVKCVEMCRVCYIISLILRLRLFVFVFLGFRYVIFSVYRSISLFVSQYRESLFCLHGLKPTQNYEQKYNFWHFSKYVCSPCGEKEQGDGTFQ